MKVLMILADGFEDIEAFTVIDVLRRAENEVMVTGLVSNMVESARKVKVNADKRLLDVDPKSYDMLVLPGGPGYKNLLNSSAVLNIIRDFDKNKKWIGAICAAPVVLAKAGILEDRVATVYPGLEKEIPKPREAKVIVVENIITSRGPGTAMDFALKLAEITNKGVTKRLKEQLVIE